MTGEHLLRSHEHLFASRQIRLADSSNMAAFFFLTPFVTFDLFKMEPWGWWVAGKV